MTKHIGGTTVILIFGFLAQIAQASNLDESSTPDENYLEESSAEDLSRSPASLENTMPPKKPNTGKKTLYCVAVDWTNSHTVTPGKCLTMAKYVAEFYKRNSGGKLILEPHSGFVSTGVAGNRGNIGLGEKLATKKYKADYYIIPNTHATFNHSGGKISHLCQILNSVAAHEVGHLLGLGHATGINPAPNDDTGSIMNPAAKSSNNLTAPQYYFLNWFIGSEIVLFDGSLNTFELKHPLSTLSNYATVIVPPSAMAGTHTARFATISSPPVCRNGGRCAVLHLTNGGGSQMVKEISVGNSYYDSKATNLDIQVRNGSNSQTIEVVVSTHN